MSKPNIVITGKIVCSENDLEMVRREVTAHIRLSRAETGNLHFDIFAAADDPCTFEVRERFVDRATFDAHTRRTRASTWWQKTGHIPRQLTITEE